MDNEVGEEDSSSRVTSVDTKDTTLCLAAIQKLVEYIKFNFLEGATAPSPTTSCRDGLDVEVQAVFLSKDKDDRELGLSFGNIPIFGDPDRKKKGGQRRRKDQGPIMDVGCIWVTEVRKRSPAANCGGIKLRDELLSLNGQLMVGVDVSGARYAQSICRPQYKTWFSEFGIYIFYLIRMFTCVCVHIIKILTILKLIIDLLIDLHICAYVLNFFFVVTWLTSAGVEAVSTLSCYDESSERLLSLPVM